MNGKKSGWLEEISTKCNVDKKDLFNLLEKYEIKQSPNIGIPKHLSLIELTFTGKKEGMYSNDFKFEMKDLDHGIYGIFSDENLRGKTTVLEIIKWLLRGSSSSLLQEGIKSWINSAHLKFKVEAQEYIVDIKQEDGIVKGSLVKCSKGKDNIICKFLDNDEFENGMSDFMTNTFSLDKISAFRKSSIQEEQGKKVNHNWSFLASALFISTNYSSLFGDIIVDGLSNRLMNMYLGLPWVSTYNSLKTAEKLISSKQKVENIHKKRDQEKYAIKVKQLELQLKNKKEELENLPDNKVIKAKLKLLRHDYNQKSNQMTKLKKELNLITDDKELSYKEMIEDLKNLENLKANIAAREIFKSINPTCCPHCEANISEEKIEREKKDNYCSICNEPLSSSDDSEDILSEYRDSYFATKKAYENIENQYKNKSKLHTDILKEIDEIEQNISNLELDLSKYERQETLEKDIFKLEILLNEYNSQFEQNMELSEDLTVDLDEKKIIDSAIKITQERFKVLQEELLAEVSYEILRMSKLVGLDQIQSIKLSSIPTLKIEKDGGSTSYSKCSEGEKLRLKVITTIALLSVAEKKQVGRHPGLLLIDSPGAQEVSPHDLDMLVDGLKKLATELPFLQIIIASRSSDVILKQIDESNRKYAKGQEYLW